MAYEYAYDSFDSSNNQVIEINYCRLSSNVNNNSNDK